MDMRTRLAAAACRLRHYVGFALLAATVCVPSGTPRDAGDGAALAVAAAAVHRASWRAGSPVRLGISRLFDPWPRTQLRRR